MAIATEHSKLVQLLGSQADNLLGYKCRGFRADTCTCRDRISSIACWPPATARPPCCGTFSRF